MLTVKQLIAASINPPKRLDRRKAPDLVANATSVQVAFGKVTEGKDARGYYKSVPGTAKTLGKTSQKRFEIRLYYPKGRSKKEAYIPPQLRQGKYEGPDKAPNITHDCRAWVFCTCEYFLFHCEVADAESDNSTINYLPRNITTTKDGKVVRITKNNGKAPIITNPNHIGHLCKHLIASLRKGALLKK